MTEPTTRTLTDAEMQERYTLRMIELQDGGTSDQFEKALADERVKGQRVIVIQRRVADGPPCPTCGFAIHTRKRAPFNFDDE